MIKDQYKSRYQLIKELGLLRRQIRALNEKKDSGAATVEYVYPDKNQYNLLLDYLTDYIYTVRVKKGTAIETLHGPGCVSVTGYKMKEFVKDPELWYRMVHKNDRAAVTRQAKQALAGKDVPPLEHRIRHKNGSIRWVRNTIILLRNENGKNYGYNGLINDITALKKAEKTLFASELKYRSLINDVLESTRVGISIMDYKYNYVWVNRAFENYLGIKRIEVVGRNARDLVITKTKNFFQNSEEYAYNVLESLAFDANTKNFECCRVSKSGRPERFLEYYSMPIKTGLYAGGRIEQYYDITEHKNILDEVIESERRHKQLLHHLTDYVYTVKVENGLPVDTFHGIGCLAVTGYTQEDFAMNPELWIEMVYEDDRPAVRVHAQKALQGEPAKPLIHRILHRDGTLHWVKSTIVLQKDDDGQVISYDGLINDITELKKAEELDYLRQQQLMQADKMVTLGILVSGVAHEINNPNNFIMLNNKMIAKVWESTKPILDEYYQHNGDFGLAGMPYSKAHDKIDELISGIGEGCVRIKKIVDNLKNFARQDTGSLDQNVDLNKVIEVAIVIVNNLIKKNTNSFTVTYEKNLPVIKGNFQKLEQIVINLITNACEALKNETKQLSIATFYHQDKAMAGFQVADTGIGIPQENLHHIIDPFFTTKREMGGTGLGLSITWNIIKDHGGDLVFDSEPGRGTTVTVTIPVLKPDEQGE